MWSFSDLFFFMRLQKILAQLLVIICIVCYLERCCQKGRILIRIKERVEALKVKAGERAEKVNNSKELSEKVFSKWSKSMDGRWTII